MKCYQLEPWRLCYISDKLYPDNDRKKIQLCCMKEMHRKVQIIAGEGVENCILQLFFSAKAIGSMVKIVNTGGTMGFCPLPLFNALTPSICVLNPPLK